MEQKLSPFKSLLFSVLIIFILFCCLEGLLRVYSYIKNKTPKSILDTLPMAISNENRIFDLKPNYHQTYKTSEFEIDIKTNSDSLRDVEHSIDKPPNTYRIVVIGDSMTFGWGVNLEDTWWKILEDKLNNNSKNIKYEVINLGVWMYTYDQQYLRLKEKGLKYQPDLVIQDIYWPHLRTIATHQWQKDENGKIIKIIDPTVYVSKEGILKTKDKNLFISFLKQHSKLLNFIISRLQTILLKKSLITSDLPLLDEDSFSKFNDTWKKAFESIKQTKQLLEEKGIPYIVFLIPREVQVSKNEWQPLFIGAMNEKRFSEDIPQKIFTNFAESEKIKILDLLPAFRTKYQPDLYFPVDPHLTKKGHELISEILFDFIKINK
jgi:lysophospholipase L1-like esterase